MSEELKEEMRKLKDEMASLKKELKDAKGGVMLEGIYENYPGEVFYAFGLE